MSVSWPPNRTLVSHVSAAVGRNRQPRPRRTPAQKARAVHDVRFAVEDRLHEVGRAARDRARGLRPEWRQSCRAPARARCGSRCPSRAFAGAWTIDRTPSTGVDAVEHFARAVGRAVVDDDNFARQRAAESAAGDR